LPSRASEPKTPQRSKPQRSFRSLRLRAFTMNRPGTPLPRLPSLLGFAAFQPFSQAKESQGSGLSIHLGGPLASRLHLPPLKTLNIPN
jgi:hypothetical protein